jgi:two-component system nitrate/nitrite sensor histidine kinase NarX
VSGEVGGTQGGRGTQVELEVADDGRGFDPAAAPPDHLGMKILRERAQAIGAELSIESAPECGTRVTVVWTRDVRPAGSKENP